MQPVQKISMNNIRVIVPWPWNTQEEYENWIEDLIKNCPESWGSSEGSTESIITEYIHQLELRVDELGGTLERYYDDSTKCSDCGKLGHNRVHHDKT